MNNLKPAQLRLKIRNSDFTGNTSGYCKGYVQGNLVILPEKYANDFHQFCLYNPQPCPLLSVSKAGAYQINDLGEDIDIRTDVPEYHIFINGKLNETVSDIKHYWRDDFVTFILGCSFSFEDALIESGINIRNIEMNKNVSMYQSNIKAKPSKYFASNYVVSMRPIKLENVDRAIQITSKFQKAHGAPLHCGDPKAIGISDLSKPDYGDSVEVREGEIPVFWACGVTPQLAIKNAKLPFAITHVPGKMLITDKRYEEL
ncbi:MAG: putative hydro-lyase [Bacteroidetes bacterium]|nr:putative hydro-lyase [Bacteroidota bacterium]